MKKILFGIILLAVLVGCGKTVETVTFEDELTELCGDFGYGWKSTIDRDYYILTYNSLPDYGFAGLLEELAHKYGYECARYPVMDGDKLVYVDYMVVR